MTILGAILAGPEHVTAWVDTAVFEPSGKPAGFRSKLRVNSRAGIVGMGAGWTSLLQHAGSAVDIASDLDDAATRVTAALRKHAAQAVDTRPAAAERFMCNGYVIAGWSPAAGRMLVYRFTASSFFAATLTTRWAQPEIAGFDSFRPYRDDQIVQFARAQMDAVRAGNPDAGAGDLSIASIGPSGIFIRTIRDFATCSERLAA